MCSKWEEVLAGEGSRYTQNIDELFASVSSRGSRLLKILERDAEHIFSLSHLGMMNLKCLSSNSHMSVSENSPRGPQFPGTSFGAHVWSERKPSDERSQVCRVECC